MYLIETESIGYNCVQGNSSKIELVFHRVKLKQMIYDFSTYYIRNALLCLWI